MEQWTTNRSRLKAELQTALEARQARGIPRATDTRNPKPETPACRQAGDTRLRQGYAVASPTSNVKRRTSNVKRPTSNVQHQTSNVQRRTSNVEQLTTDRKYSMFNAQYSMLKFVHGTTDN